MSLDAAFTVNSNVGAAPFSVTFSSTLLEGTASSYLWDFGDGTTSTQASPTHTYNNLGLYTVKLTVSNSSTSESITLTKNKHIIVVAVDFEAIPVQGYAPLSVKFTDKSTAPTGFSIASRSWSFGDGSSAVTSQNPVHSYSQPGTYAVDLQLTVKRT